MRNYRIVKGKVSRPDSDRTENRQFGMAARFVAGRPARRRTLSILHCFGAIEGTRTPTPLRVHGPEPCASANSATMAILNCNAAAALRPPCQEDQHFYFTARYQPVKPTPHLQEPESRSR